MANLAQLTVNEVSAVCQAATHTESLSLAASVPESFTVPTDSGTGLKADFVVFGASIYTDFYARVFTVYEGTDRITNGTFATDTDWTKGAGWTIAAGVATATGAISTALSQTANTSFPIIANQQYLLTYTITRSAGTITPSIGGTAGTGQVLTGTYSEVIKAGATQSISFGTTGFTGTIDNITLTACAGVPVDNTSGLVARQNPAGFALGATPSYISVVMPVAGVITASFYKGKL